MLQKMILTNFLSFRERTEFDFTPSKYGILNETNVSSGGQLKGALFIGPNASGKTNALKGLEFLICLISGEMQGLSEYKCIFSGTAGMEAEYVFSFSGSTIIYTVGYDTTKNALTEKLVKDGKSVLSRKGTHGVLLLGEKKIEEDQLDAKTAFLRTASFNTGRFPQDPLLRALMEYIANSFFVDNDQFYAKMGKRVERYAEEYQLDKLNRYLKEFHYDFSIIYKSLNELFPNSNGSADESEKKIPFFVRNTFPIPVPLVVESQGNQVFADILPAIISVIEKPGMLVIDEFGNSLHNVLAEKIVRFFMEKADQSQLFITSHCTNLISNSVFRPDQIDLVTFAKEGEKGNVWSSRVTRLSKYKPREAQNLEKMYLGGMFEGLPNYGKEIQS